MVNRIQIVILRIQNRKHEKDREQLGKAGKSVDKSMMAVTVAVEDDAESKATGKDNSLDDVTDWQNEDFVYVY